MHDDREVVDQPAPVKVLIVDDHRMFGQTLHRVLDSETQIDVVGTAVTIAEGLEAVKTEAPDVVLMDYDLPDGAGTEGAQLVKAERPETKVVMLSGSVDDGKLSEAIDAGCFGFVTKDEPVESVVTSVRDVAAGKRLFTRSTLLRILPLLRHHRERRRARAEQRDLTRRELEVLGLMAEGLSARDIAERLVISVNTARHHVQQAIAKLGAHSKLEAVSIAVREGIIRYR